MGGLRFMLMSYANYQVEYQMRIFEQHYSSKYVNIFEFRLALTFHHELHNRESFKPAIGPLDHDDSYSFLGTDSRQPKRQTF